MDIILSFLVTNPEFTGLLIFTAFEKLLKISRFKYDDILIDVSKDVIGMVIEKVKKKKVLK